MNPQYAYISGPGCDHVRGLIMTEPHVGDPMRLFLDDGKLMSTSEVRNVSRDGSDLVVETKNSKYRVTLAD